MKTRHTPIRTCAACRATQPKPRLLRVVLHTDGIIVFDATKKQNGRGAWICPDTRCISLAQKQRRFEKALKTQKLAPELFEALLRAAASTIDEGETA
ncbi:MAG: YlxR family protein [Armatimonadetes bacterium]|nr:YlxR family protein [Armatimonadota bacterium]MDE2206575.1 YlxR family protein [Armatimonadota bacterium]